MPWAHRKEYVLFRNNQYIEVGIRLPDVINTNIAPPLYISTSQAANQQGRPMWHARY